MGQLILTLGRKKIKLPEELNELKQNKFVAAEYSFENIKNILIEKSFSNINYDIGKYIKKSKS